MRGNGPDPDPRETEYAGAVCFAPAGWFEGVRPSSAPAQLGRPRVQPAARAIPHGPARKKALLLGGNEDDVASVEALLRTRGYPPGEVISLVPGAIEAGLRLCMRNVAGWIDWLAESRGDTVFVYIGAGVAMDGDLRRLVHSLDGGRLTLVSEAPLMLGLAYAHPANVDDLPVALLPASSHHDDNLDRELLVLALTPRCRRGTSAAPSTPGANIVQALATVLGRHGAMCYRTLLRELADEMGAEVQLSSSQPLDLDALFIA